MSRANPVQLEAVMHTEVLLQLRQFHPRSLAQRIFRVSRMKFSGRHFPKDLILQAIRWYVSYPLKFADETLAGIALCHILRKGQHPGSDSTPAWEYFYSLAE